MNSKQFAWLYLVENGDANVTISYYGGKVFIDPALNEFRFNPAKYQEHNKECLDKIRAVGVNWSKTQVPESDIKSQFNGTFNDGENVEYLEGTLVLNDGTKQIWLAESLKVTNVFDMMAAVHEASEKFAQIFG